VSKPTLLTQEIAIAREKIAENRKASRELRDAQRTYREALVKRRVARNAR
jgi:hypothetical protein